MIEITINPAIAQFAATPGRLDPRYLTAPTPVPPAIP